MSFNILTNPKFLELVNECNSDTSSKKIIVLCGTPQVYLDSIFTKINGYFKDDFTQRTFRLLGYESEDLINLTIRDCFAESEYRDILISINSLEKLRIFHIIYYYILCEPFQRETFLEHIKDYDEEQYKFFKNLDNISLKDRSLVVIDINGDLVLKEQFDFEDYAFNYNCFQVRETLLFEDAEFISDCLGSKKVIPFSCDAETVRMFLDISIKAFGEKLKRSAKPYVRPVEELTGLLNNAWFLHEFFKPVRKYIAEENSNMDETIFDELQSDKDILPIIKKVIDENPEVFKSYIHQL